MKSVFRGALINVFARWVDRGIGLVSTVILARLLTPADFGLVGMAFITIGLFEVLLDFGVRTALLQKKHIEREDYDSAWTLGILQALLLSVGVIVVAPFAADYFRNEQVGAVIRVLAPMAVLGSFGNVGLVMLQKEMQFAREFRYLVSRRVITFLITIAAAYWTRSYWGLVIGTYGGVFAGVVLSYLFHAYRPKLGFSRVAALWSFSQWLLLRNVGFYLLQQTDKFILGRRVPAATLGAYRAADDLANLPSGELLAPLGRALLPAMAGQQDDANALRRTFLLAFSVSAIAVLPACIGFGLVGREIVLVVLGDKWMQAVPFIGVLSVVGAIVSLSHAAGYVLLSKARFRAQTLVVYAQLAAMILLAVVAFPDAPPIAVAWMRVAVAGLGAVGVFALMRRVLPEVSWSDLCRAVWRPLAALLLMAACVSAIQVEGVPVVALLLMKVAAGALAYALTVLLLWQFSGKPDGAERYLLSKMRIGRA